MNQQDHDLLIELCTVALNPKVHDHLPYGCLERAKEYLSRPPDDVAPDDVAREREEAAAAWCKKMGWEDK
jgi:hypothetical protein